MATVSKCECPPMNCLENLRDRWISLEEYEGTGLNVFHCPYCGLDIIEGNGIRPITYVKYRAIIDSIRTNESRVLDFDHIKTEMERSEGKQLNHTTTAKIVDCFSVGEEPLISRNQLNDGADTIYEVSSKNDVICSSSIAFPYNGETKVQRGLGQLTTLAV